MWLNALFFVQIAQISSKIIAKQKKFFANVWLYTFLPPTHINTLYISVNIYICKCIYVLVCK